MARLPLLVIALLKLLSLIVLPQHLLGQEHRLLHPLDAQLSLHLEPALLLRLLAGVQPLHHLGLVQRLQPSLP